MRMVTTLGDSLGRCSQLSGRKHIKHTFMDSCKVPYVPLYRVRKESCSFVAIGRLMLHMAGLTPCQIARSTFISLVFNEPPDEQCLLTDLRKHIKHLSQIEICDRW